MRIKKFHELNEAVGDTGLLGLSSGGHRRIPARTNRRTQYFYDYYTGQRIRGKSKYELNTEVFKMAQKGDDLATLAQFALQVERESMAYDYVDREEDKRRDSIETEKPVAAEIEEVIENLQTINEGEVDDFKKAIQDIELALDKLKKLVPLA